MTTIVSAAPVLVSGQHALAWVEETGQVLVDQSGRILYGNGNISYPYPKTTTAGIQEAINSLPPAGGRILIKAGTYNISNSITVTGSYVEIEGETGLGVILSNKISTSGDALLSYVGTSGSHIDGPFLKNLFLQGNSDAGHGLMLQYCNNPDLRNVYIENFVGYGLAIKTVNDGYFGNINLYGCGDATNLYEQLYIDSFSDASFYYLAASTPSYTNIHLVNAADINFYGTAIGTTATDANTQVLLDNGGPNRILFSGLDIYGGGTSCDAIIDNGDLILYSGLRINNCAGNGYVKNAGGGSALISGYQASGQSSSAKMSNMIDLTSGTTGNVTVNGLYATNVSTVATYNAPGSYVLIRGSIPAPGWLTAPAVPAGTGSTYEVQNTFPYSVIVEAMSSPSGTHIVDANGTDELVADNLLQYLQPKEKIYYATTVPSSWKWKALT